MKNKLLMGTCISILVVLSSTNAKIYLWTPPLADTVVTAMEFGVDQNTAQKMYDDGVQDRFIRPEFVKSWQKDKQGQISGANQLKDLNKKFNNPVLISAQEKVKQLAESLVKGNSLQLFEIKKSLSLDEFMAYTDVLWHRKTGMPLLKHRPEFNKSKLNKQQGTASTVGSGNDCDFPNLLTAINFAADGGSIFVAAETFTGANAKLVINKNLSITGGLDSNCQVFTADRTVLDLGQTGPVVSIDVSGGNTVTLNGFEITGATNDGSNFTSGIYATGNGTLNIGNSHIHDNQSSFGGGIGIESGVTLNLNDSSEVYANTAVQSGGGIFCDTSTITASDTLIGRFNGVTQGNTVNSLGLGGGIYAETCMIDLGDDAGDNAPVEVSYNHANSGGGLYLVGSALQFSHPQSRVSFNTSGAIGMGEASGIYARQNSTMDLFDLKITDNSPNVGVGLSNSFINGTSNCNSSPCLEISRNTEEGFYLTDGAGIDVSHAVMSNNGTAVAVDSSTQVNAILQNTNIINHQGNDPLISVDSPVGVASVVRLNYVTVANNQISGGLFDSRNNSLVNSEAVIIWDNSATDLFAAGANGGSVTNSVIQYSTAGMTNTVQQDPKFVDANNGDFHILPISPAIDRSNLISLTDINGEARPQGNAYDAGSDENGKRIGINGAACQYSSISAAVAAASDNDIIYIVPGFYQETVGLINKDLGFISSMVDCSAADTQVLNSAVIIDGNGLNRANGGLIEISAGKMVDFTNLTLQNAKSDIGGIIYINQQSTLNLTDVTVKSGTATTKGGNIASDNDVTINLYGDSALLAGVSTTGGAAYIRINSILKLYDTAHIGVEDFGNFANNGGGVYAKSGLLPQDVSRVMLFDQSYIRSNIALQNGGGVFLGDSIITMQDQSSIGTAFDSGANVAVSGAGVYMVDIVIEPGSIGSTINMLDQSRVQHNKASLSGAGIYAEGAKMVLNLDSGSVNDNWVAMADNPGKGAGIYLVNDGVLFSSLIMNNGFTVNNNDWTPVSSLFNGGGIYLKGSKVQATITGATISQNKARFGGGVYLNQITSFTLNQTSIIENEAIDSEFAPGGGIYAIASNLVINEGTITNNTTTGLGAGIKLTLSSLQMNNSLISGNTAATNGGGLALSASAATLLNTVVENNQAGSGGGVSLISGSSFNMDSDTICRQSQIAPAYCSRVSNNTATSNIGHAIKVLGSSQVSAKGTVINNHPQAQSNAINLDGTDATFNASNVLFVDNGGVGIDGGDSTVILQHTTHSNSGLSLNTLAANTNVSNSIIWDSPVTIPNGIAGSCNISPNAELTGGSGDPLFKTELQGPYHLGANSPAVDACFTSLVTDLDGKNRPIDSDGIASGAESDMGAFERQLFATLDVSVTGMGTIVSDVTGINCGNDCTEEYELGTALQLQATPDAGYVLQSWSGSCAGQSNTCFLTLNSNENIQVTFVREYTVTVNVVQETGIGHVESSIPGIFCGNNGTNCVANYPEATVLQLNASADNANSAFSHWTGDCQGQSASCGLNINSDVDTTAYFVNPDIIFKNGFEE